MKNQTNTKLNLTFIFTALMFQAFIGCRSFYNKSFDIEVLKPAPINIGRQPKLSIIETLGPLRYMEEDFAFAFINQSRRRGYNFDSKISKRIHLYDQNGNPFFENMPEFLQNDKNNNYCTIEIISKIDVPFFKNETEKIKEKIIIDAVTDRFGNIILPSRVVDTVYNKIVTKEFIKNEVSLLITIANTKEYIIKNKEFGSSLVWEIENAPPTQELRYLANFDIITNNFLNVISYGFESTKTYLDNSDERQQYIIDEVKRISPKWGISEFEKFISYNPYSSSAHYNIAVLYDVLGDYNNALYYYDKAIELNPTERSYHKVREECLRRVYYLNQTK